MAVDFSQFTPKTTALSTDYLVGYDLNASGGEKKFTLSTIANAVSSVASLGTVKSVTGTAPISVANGTTTPAISIAAATTSAAGSMSSTDKTRLDDASTVNGLLSCNGSGNFSAAVAGTDYVTSGSPMVAKAWGVFNGLVPVSILGSYNINIAGITRTAQGKYTITFQNPMPNTNYSVVASSTSVGTGWGMPTWHYGGIQVNSFELWFGKADTISTFYDCSRFSIAVFA